MSIDAGVAAVGRDAGMEAPVLGAAGVASMGAGVAMEAFRVAFALPAQTIMQEQRECDNSSSLCSMLCRRK
jgi:hypothetical protein